MSDDKIVNNQISDYVAMAAKGILGAAPFVGSLLAELAGNYIPNQRMDRITKFALILEKRFEEIEQKNRLMEQIQAPHGADLLEEGMRQAASSLSDERREYIANLIAHGVASEDVETHESKHLLNLLGELSDVEIIWLRYYADPITRSDSEFRKKHELVLKTHRTYLGAPQSNFDQESLSNSYKIHLSRLGLLRERYAVDQKTKLPKIDSNGRFEIKGYELTTFGRLLLRFIGLPDERDT